NTASRMETSGEAGKINISGETYSIVKNFFDCEYRGKLEAKHKNQFDMYYVIRIRKEYSKNEDGTFPNDLFYKKLNETLDIEFRRKSIYDV
ncbi:MAG: adenylate/guanylate cyclase domain-containing protein, partial [Bacteroidales bacterium]